MEAVCKIGLVVSGDVDKVVAETLARRCVDNANIHIHAVRVGGVADRTVAMVARMLLEEKNHDHVIVLLDTDSTLLREIERKRFTLESALTQEGLTTREFSVCPVVPEMEAWLLTEFSLNPEDSHDPKRDLAERVGRVTAEVATRLALGLNLVQARKRSSSLNEFVRTLEALASPAAQAPAA